MVISLNNIFLYANYFVILHIDSEASHIIVFGCIKWLDYIIPLCVYKQYTTRYI